jgi:hypothetical protein
MSFITGSHENCLNDFEKDVLLLNHCSKERSFREFEKTFGRVWKQAEHVCPKLIPEIAKISINWEGIKFCNMEPKEAIELQRKIAKKSAKALTKAVEKAMPKLNIIQKVRMEALKTAITDVISNGHAALPELEKKLKQDGINVVAGLPFLSDSTTPLKSTILDFYLNIKTISVNIPLAFKVIKLLLAHGVRVTEYTELTLFKFLKNNSEHIDQALIESLMKQTTTDANDFFDQIFDQAVNRGDTVQTRLLISYGFGNADTLRLSQENQEGIRKLMELRDASFKEMVHERCMDALPRFSGDVVGMVKMYQPIALVDLSSQERLELHNRCMAKLSSIKLMGDLSTFMQPFKCL